jgi:hypothetical protein
MGTGLKISMLVYRRKCDQESVESKPFQTRTIRRGLGIPHETFTDREKVRPGTGRETGLGHVGDERTGRYSQRVSGGIPNLRRIPEGS